MRFLLCSAVTLLALASVCNAGCFLRRLVLVDIMNPPKGCQDADGEMHDFLSEWTKNCYECSCFHTGMVCCDTIPTQRMVSSECEMIVDRKACTSKLVLKSDKSKECV